MGLSVASERQCGVGAALARFLLSSILPSMRKGDLLAWRGTGIGAGVTATAERPHSYPFGTSGRAHATTDMGHYLP
jgi:hypothetical protein